MKPKKLNLWLSILIILTALGLVAFTPAAPPIQAPDNDQFVLGENYTLEEGETLTGSLIVLGGNADLEAGSTVERDVVILGGNLRANGLIEGDVNIIAGIATLGETARIEGDVNALSSNLLRDEGAEILGQVNTNTRFPFLFGAPANLTLPDLPGDGPLRPQTPVPTALDMGLNFIGGVIWWLGRSFMWAFLALLVLLFMPRHVQRVSDSAVIQPVAAGGLGVLTAIVVPVVLGLLALTICGIPITLAGLLLLAAGWAVGMIALGLETGARLERLVHQDWAPSVQAAVGTFTLTLAINGIGAIIPCIGWLVPFVVGAVGLGAVLLTRFGSQVYPPAVQPLAPYSPGVQPPGAAVFDEVNNRLDDDLPPPL